MGSKYFAKLTLILFLISAVVAALLGAVNAITENRIIAANREKTVSAMKVVMPEAASFEEFSYKGKDPLVTEIYLAKGKSGSLGYVVKVTPTGFGGAIDMVVGVSSAGKVTGVSIINMSETPGLGTNASKDAFRGQFVGKSGTQAVTKDGGKINAITGATVTSRAVSKGVTSALEAVASLG